MSNSTKIERALPIKERLLLARGGALAEPSTALEVLVALTADAEREVSEAAAAMLANIPEERCREWLNSPISRAWL